ncbi:hypothetical protein P5V15_007300 [Pogonomyrmex californicus]
MPKYLKTQHENGRKFHGRKTALNSLTSEVFAARYNELIELNTQLVTNFRISSSLQSRWRKSNRTETNKIEEQAISNSSKAIQDNMTHPMEFPSRLKEKNTNNTIEKSEDTTKKETKSDRTVTVSTDDKCRTKNLVKNQTDTDDRLRREDKTEAQIIAKIENKFDIENEQCNGKISNENKKKKKARNAGKTKKLFSDHIPVSKMKNILKKRHSDEEYVIGNLRINPSFYKFAYLRLENDERDLLIVGTANRNRAFEGDLVVACVHPEQSWHKFPDGQIQKTGKIVCILEKVHSRKAVGFLKKQDSLLMFYPRDQRVPLVNILPESVPSLYYDRADLCNTMFLVVIDFWEKIYASGRVISVVGKAGEIDTELQAIILENNIDISPYQETLLEGLPDSNNILTDIDMKNREDWRHECIFTIDPATAVDIDDAVSCKDLDNGNYEIAVHISDVTHYLKFFSPLDKEVSKRATSVYLPHMTYHMLPEKLCKVCSLLPGKDRLAFSVIWEVTPNAEIVKHRFARTVVRSCCQMSYESAQAMIDNPGKSWPKDFLDIKADYTASLLSDIVNKLFKLSTQLRRKRFVNGALKLDQPKLQICIDTRLSQDYGMPIPINYYLYEVKDSNSLIEEFMLLANMTVATQLYIAIPQTALLRIHKNPSKHSLNTIQNIMQKYGIHLDIETAGALQASIQRYNLENDSVTVDAMKYIMLVIINLCSKSMLRAEYVCASTIPVQDLKHYALNVPLYTHFTSPIRRYSDCIVHRLLSATLENKSLPSKWTAKLCSMIAANCNVKKYSAKQAQEQSTELFFAYMVGLAGNFEAAATVMNVKEDTLDIILCDAGIKLKINLKDIEYIASLKYSIDYVPTMTVNWKKPPIIQVINLFSLIRVQVTKIDEELRLKAILLPPTQ